MPGSSRDVKGLEGCVMEGWGVCETNGRVEKVTAIRSWGRHGFLLHPLQSAETCPDLGLMQSPCREEEKGTTATGRSADFGKLPFRKGTDHHALMILLFSSALGSQLIVTDLLCRDFRVILVGRCQPVEDVMHAQIWFQLFQPPISSSMLMYRHCFPGRLAM